MKNFIELSCLNILHKLDPRPESVIRVLKISKSFLGMQLKILVILRITFHFFQKLLPL